MKFQEYLDYKCININRLAERLDITRRRLAHSSAPFNLTYLEVEKLKAFVGDWDSYEKQEEEGK